MYPGGDGRKKTERTKYPDDKILDDLVLHTDLNEISFSPTLEDN